MKMMRKKNIVSKLISENNVLITRTSGLFRFNENLLNAPEVRNFNLRRHEFQINRSTNSHRFNEKKMEIRVRF